MWRITAASLAAVVRADLPVHCLHHEIKGDWEFKLGPLSNVRSSCGHRKPDNQNMEPGTSFVDSGSATSVDVSLSDPSFARSSQMGTGSWTMIYDEGFETTLGNQVFFAFSKFTLDHGRNTSYCDGTLVGWYHDKERTQFGCFYGQKKNSGYDSDSLGASFQSNFLASPRPEPSASNPSMLATRRLPRLGDDLWSSSFMDEIPWNEHQNFVNHLNLMQTSWTAKTYEKYRGRSHKDMNKMAGIQRTLPISEHKHHFPHDHHKHHNESMSFIERNRRHHRMGRADDWRASSFGDDDENFDWRNARGGNYLEEVIDQGECGSCYTVATVRMLSARRKVMENDINAEPFSISVPLHCAEYNQGCDGGYAFLASKWSADVGLVPQSCSHYNINGGCNVQCDMSQSGTRYRATNHRYIGGYYGASNEQVIKDELRRNGPLVLSFEPKGDLMYYSGGIYKSFSDPHTEWQKVDHAVLLVGYGVEDGQKYWTLQNSWGPDWGEGGFFRMARGDNDSGVESIAVAAEVTTDDHPEVLDNVLRHQDL